MTVGMVLSNIVDIAFVSLVVTLIACILAVILTLTIRQVYRLVTVRCLSCGRKKSVCQNSCWRTMG